MALKLKEFWESRVLSEDKRIIVNRVIKDILFYGLMVICFGLLILAISGTLDGTKYGMYLAGAIVVVRVILKALEKYRKEDFHWFWEKMEWLMKLINAILEAMNKKPLPVPSDDTDEE